MSRIDLPELGENIENVTISSVLVSEGDTVKKDQPIVEVETEKASLEVPATSAGKVTKVHVSAGDSVSIGSPLIEVDDDDGAAAGGSEDDADTGTSGDGGDEAEEKREPAEDRDGEESEEAETKKEKKEEKKEKKTAKDEQGDDRRERDREEPEDREAESGDGKPSGAAGPPTPADARERKLAELGDPAPAAPSVRRLARELGLDLRDVDGSGPGGRISRDDVVGRAREVITSGGGAGVGEATAASAPGEIPALPDFSSFGETEREPLSALRRTAAEGLARSWAQIPHVTQHDRADVTELEAFRSRFAKRAEREGVKLTVTAMAIRIVAEALRRFPRFNASYDARSREIVLKKYVHVGVAVDTERGLMVPVVRDADRKGVLAIAGELADLAERARGKKIQPDEMRGASFTVSNLGGLGTTTFTPIVNWPEVAILGVGRATVEPTWRDDGFEPRTILPLSVSYDHRVIDGADAARFLRFVAESLENPMRMLLEG